MELDMVADIDMEIQFGERAGHRRWLIGPKHRGWFFWREAYPACASSRLCEFIVFFGILWDPCPLEVLFSSVSLLFV